MNDDRQGKPEPRENNPEKIPEWLELELLQKRAAWQRTKANRSSIRAVSFLFLFVVIVAALLAFYYVTSVMERPVPLQNQDAAATATPSPAPSR